jgi:hypothetical protein
VALEQRATGSHISAQVAPEKRVMQRVHNIIHERYRNTEKECRSQNYYGTPLPKIFHYATSKLKVEKFGYTVKKANADS